MSDNALKTPLGQSLNRFGQKKAQDAIALLGRALPASVVHVTGSIVTVKFEVTATPFTIPNVTCPLFGPEYIRYPIQVGDKGVCFPSDVYLGGMSGLGGGVADLTQRAPLAALVFFPIGNKTWTAPDDPNKVVIYGPDGVIIRSLNGVHKIIVDQDQVRVVGDLHVQGNLLIDGFFLNIDGSVYPHTIATSGEVVALSGLPGQVTLSGHEQTGVQPGSGDSGPPKAGT